MFSSHSKIGIVGSGAMGSGIAQVAATSGHTVIVYDNHKTALEKAQKNLNASLIKLTEKQKITKEHSATIFENTLFTAELDELKDCDLVIEAIVENLQVKQNVFTELEKIVSESCVLATNTSSLSIASIAAACKKPQRVLGIHFFNPATLMPLVEIIPGLATDPAFVSACRSLVDSWGKTTVLAKDTPGFIVNRVARPYYGEALRIYEEGIADIATIDWAMKEIGGFKMGPFELMDLIGHDVNYIVTETVWKQFYYDPRFKPALAQKRLLEAGYLGRKSGKGFYNYSEGEKMPEPHKDDALGKFIFGRIVAMLVNEAADALYHKIATKEDIDLAMTKGVNYPKGLLQWGDELGLTNVLNILKALRELYEEDRYRASVLLKQMVMENRKFYN
jgi:3-hydroxybutyryl-CoA dehydrogenase